MTGEETAAELRALVERLRSDPLTWESAHATIREAADAIDGMLARLDAAEADADQLYDMLDTHWDSGSHCNDWVEEDDEAMQLHREALALRDPG